MKSFINYSAVILVLMISAQLSFANVVVYPEKGQSAKQKEKDKNECSEWAKQQTGIDPQAVAEVAPNPSGQAKQGGAVKGAAKGAAAGASPVSAERRTCFLQSG
jgi:hypothetical protein